MFLVPSLLLSFMLHAKLLGCTERLRTCTMRFGYLRVLDVGLGMAGAQRALGPPAPHSSLGA